jgi:hypothetical protein
MTDDRQAERQVPALFEAAAPANAPLRLRTEIRGIPRSTRQRARWIAFIKEPPMRLANHVIVGSPMARLTTTATAGLAVAILMVSAVIAAAPAPSELPVGASLSPSASMSPPPVPSSPTATPTPRPPINGWISARGGPAGLYSWTVDTEWSWMHKSGGAAGTSVEISMKALLDEGYGPGLYDISNPYVGDERPYPETPERISDVRMQLWVMDLDGTRVGIAIKSYPGTSAELLAEAEAVVQSMHPEPIPGSTGRRVVFTLLDGWDSG